VDKLFKLKQWMNLDDACEHLSLVFSAPVKKSDLFQLALDKKLVLSVDLVNRAKAKIGKLVPRSEAKTIELNGPFAEAMVETFGDTTCLSYLEGIAYTDNQQLILEEQVYSIDGIWDIPMVGSEALDISHYYQLETDGSPIQLINLNGTFLEKEVETGKLVAQIQERFDKENRLKIGIDDLPYNSDQNYFPAGALPDDCNIVVKTENLTKLISSASSTQNEPSAKSKNRYLSTIHALSTALADGLTNKPSKDAKLIIQILAQKGIELEIGERTLINYLKSAQDLIK